MSHYLDGPEGPRQSRNGYIGLEHTDLEDPTIDEPYRRLDLWASTRNLALCIQKKHGSDRMAFWKNQEEAPEYEEGKTDYTNWQLGAMADEMLRKDSRRELCRDCLKEDVEEPYGEETGVIETQPVTEKSGELKLDEEGNVILADYPQYVCAEGHEWFIGEGKEKSIQGKNPILFEEHLQNRRKREIYTQVGTPDPSIVAGIYNRMHPQGRKVNSPEQRRRNGASFFR